MEQPPAMHRMSCSNRLLASVIFVASIMVGGCAATTQSQSPATTAQAERDRTTEVPTTYVTPDDAGMIVTRMQEANGWLLAGDYDRAAVAFEKIISFEPNGEYAAAARFNAGFAYEQLGRRDLALAQYRAVIDRHAESEEARGALLRSSRLYAHAEEWEPLTQVSEQTLARPDLELMERIEALGARGLGLVQLGRVSEGALVIGKARDLIEEHRLHEAGKLTVGMAQVFFALGEVRRIRGESITFVPVPDNFADVLEARCQSLLDAQDAYATAMRAYDAHWSAMSGYRVGSMYQQLHRDLMKIPPPPSAKTQRQRELFEGAMQLRYRVLLEKGLKMMERTVAMAERTGESSSWVNRAKDAKRDLELALDGAREALAKLPFQEADLQRALDGLRGTPP